MNKKIRNGLGVALLMSQALSASAGGPCNLPYSENFTTASWQNDFTIIDANNDGSTWFWNKFDYPREDESSARLKYGNANKNNDDWLITPGLNLTAGCYYDLSLEIYPQYANDKEKVAIYLGQYPTEASMTTEIMPVTVFTGTPDNKNYVTKRFVAPATGVYYIGIHSTTPYNDAYYLNIDNISVSAGVTASAPAAVTDLTATPGQYGALTCKLDFTAPTTNIDGSALSAISRVEIYRGDEKIGQTDATPGERGTFTDQNARAGESTYKVVAFSGDAAGEPAEVSCFVGVGKPLQVSEVRATRGADTGEVKISWDRVNRDINGMELLDSQVLYDVYRAEDETHQLVVASGTNALEATDRVCQPDADEQFVIYQVRAYTTTGWAAETESNIVPVGRPDTLPFKESVAGGHLTKGWAQQLPEENGEYWQNATDDYVDGISSADLDGGYMVMNSDYIGYEGTLMSGNISIPANSQNPGLSFYYWNYDSDNYIDVLINDGNGFVNLRKVSLDGSDVQDGWVHKVIPLQEYKGKTVRIAFRGVIVNTNVLALDDITIDRILTSDLAARELLMPESVRPNEPFVITLHIDNLGTEAADGYTVTLYRNDKEIQTLQGEPIPASEGVTITFGQQVDVFAGATARYHAVVEYDADQNVVNNTSRSAIVEVKQPNTPVAANLSAISDNGAVTLTWDMPDLGNAVPDATTDDVESYVPFSIGLPGSEIGSLDNMGAWSVIDGDGKSTFVLSGTPFLNSGTPKSFMVFNGAMTGVAGTHSGQQMFMSFDAYDEVTERAVTTDDWLISPELYGCAQNVRFFARSMNSAFLETIEMYYSLTDKERDSFVKAGSVAKVSADWTEYNFDVPEGARYFAIRNVSNDQFALCIDDISYVPMDTELANLTIEGYNIYRNKQKLNDAPVNALTFVDSNVPEGENVYNVTVQYGVGESLPSNDALVVMTDVADITAGTVKVAAGIEEITITGAGGAAVRIYRVDGTTIYSAVASDRVAVSVCPGIYIVCVGNRTVKVVVR